MKSKQNILALIALGLVMGISGAQAQTYWNGSTTVQTTTTGNCTVNGGNLSLQQLGGVDTWRNITAGSISAGLNLFAGIDYTSTGISLYSSGSTTNPGIIQFTSSGTIPGTLAFNFQYNHAGLFNTIMNVWQNGNIDINGYNISMFPPAGSTDGKRTISANSNSYGLNLLAGSDGTNTAIGLNSRGSSTNPGQIGLISSGTAPSDLIYNFLNYTAATSSWDPILGILKNGDVSFHGYTISMNPPAGSTTDGFRSIQANSTLGGLNLFAGSDYTSTGISLYSSGSTTNPGIIQFTSSGTIPGTLAFNFQYNHAGSFNTIMNVWQNGNIDINGYNISMFPPAGSTDGKRTISANSNSYGLNLLAGSDGTNTGICLNSRGSTPSRGQIAFISSGTAASDLIYNFLNYTTSTSSWDQILGIQKNGDVSFHGYTINLDPPAGSTTDGVRTIQANSTNGGLNLLAGSDGTNTLISLNSKGSSTNPGQIGMISCNSIPTDYVYYFMNYNTGSSSYTPLMSMQTSGKVAIGADIAGAGGTSGLTPDGYLLFVEKGILTEKLKVANHSDFNWSDYVFNKDYDLMPLTKVEAFVKANKHLPEIPSASEVAKEGIDVASMDAKLLQKIEELTLYVIQQQKEIDELKKQRNH